MHDKKLTDSEIVKALRSWLEEIRKARQAYLEKINEEHFPSMRYEYLLSDTIHELKRLQAEKEALINGQETLQKYIAEQKAEIEKLQKFKAYFDFYYGCDIEILGIDENGDTTSFDEFYNCAIANAESIEHHIEHIIKTAKAEAYKECIEKVEKIICDNTYPDFDINHKAVNVWKAEAYKNINNLLKETYTSSVAEATPSPPNKGEG